VIVARSKAELGDALREGCAEGSSIGLVPTMGSLHDGHLSLLRAARERCDLVVMSLFLNPAQFGPDEDLVSYPRDESRDLGLAADAGADVVYAPAADEVYPEGFATTVEVGGGLTDVLCGAPERRGPAHFRGVTTVVAKLFNTVGPSVAFFGQKDAQQAVVIRRMARDLDFPVEIEPTWVRAIAPGLSRSTARFARPRPSPHPGRPKPSRRSRRRGRNWSAPASIPSTWKRATPRAWLRSRR
jgi:pantoate--beta-alanine ligase